jgi:phytoene dehydrogenase-like protein
VRDLLGSQGTSGPVMPVVLLAQMWDFMAVEGIWYPRTGIGTLGEALAQRVRDLGGEVVLGERVEEILVRTGVAAGVRTAARTVRAPLVVSDVDYRSLFRDLLQPSDAILTERHLADTLPLSSSAFTVFLGVDAARVDLSALRGHHLLARLDEGEPVPWPAKAPRAEDFRADELWLSWWSRHATTGGHGSAPPGAEALVLKVMAPWGPPFSTLDGGARRRHKEPYYRLKEEFADAVVAVAEEVLPGLARAVVVREVATPLTYRYWGHRSGGSVAGWSWRAADLPGAWARSLTRTSVPGLLVAGMQAYTRLLFGGAGTAVFSGLKAAELALGRA